MGLGLSICQSIVSAHEGALSLVPRLPHGAVLRIERPGSLVTHTSRVKVSSPQTATSLADAPDVASAVLDR
jgi:hypothetical protein